MWIDLARQTEATLIPKVYDLTGRVQPYVSDPSLIIEYITNNPLPVAALVGSFCAIGGGVAKLVSYIKTKDFTQKLTEKDSEIEAIRSKDKATIKMLEEQVKEEKENHTTILEVNKEQNTLLGLQKERIEELKQTAERLETECGDALNEAEKWQKKAEAKLTIQ